MMNRRAFLKLFIGTVAVVAIPIPKFLLPKEVETAWKGTPYEASGGVLTEQMLIDAMNRAIHNQGQPDRIYMSKRDYKKFGKVFGYKIEYVGDEIVHNR